MKKLGLSVIMCNIFSLLLGQSVTQLWAPIREGGTSLNNNVGVLKSMSSDGNNLKTYLAFDSVNTGSTPQYTELIEYNNMFYGMTSRGGRDSGVIFQWNPITNVVTKKLDFDILKGTFPYGSLTIVNNKCYGLTWHSANGFVLFEWDPNTNSYVIKSSFSGIQGEYPYGSLTEFNNKLYGMTMSGGLNNAGVIFEYDITAGIYTKKIDLNSATGSRPYGSLVLLNGKFYGMTRDGGPTDDGSIFEWDPVTNIFTPKYFFNGTDGSSPYSDMSYYNNKFYGITYQGGINNAGVIFEWDPATNNYVKKADMNFSDGRFSTTKLKLLSNKFYGYTSGGGANNLGVIFEWDPATNIYSKKIDLTSAGGSSPKGSLTVWGNKFVGLITDGGAYNKGVIIEWDPSTNNYVKKYDFPSISTAKGSLPLNSMTFYNGKLYGTTSSGGANNAGTIYEWDPATKTHKKKYDFDNINGASPISKLTLKNDKFYGVTFSGGINGVGVIYEWDPVINNYSKKYDFSNINGQNPSGDLIENGGVFYGTTRLGGLSNLGVIYAWDTASNTYTKKVDLAASSGSQPHGSLVFYNNTFYGMTTSGGANNAGVIFQWDQGTNGFIKKYDMVAADGSFPRGILVLHTNNKFYGLTRDGGLNNLGTLFEWDPATNNYSKKYDFNNTDGANPQGSLVLSNGKFYGMTQNGGSASRGVIFEWDPATSVYSVKKNLMSLEEGWNPAFENNFIVIPAPIAPGNANACTNVPSITIDATNNNVWVPIVDNDGNVLAEIKANGNNLGLITTSFYINTGSVREDANHVLYLDRNFTITPQTQPTIPVDIRLYITEEEFQALRNAVNSQGQPSGINVITDVRIFKNSNACLSAVLGVLDPVPVNAGISYNGYGYMLSASITSFSAFYLMPASVALPLHIIEFLGQVSGNNVILKWKTYNNADVVSYTIEKSTNGRDFLGIGTRPSLNSNSAEIYSFTDSGAINSTFPRLFYRIAESKINGSIDYSNIIAVPVQEKKTRLALYPNPLNDKGTLWFSMNMTQKVYWKVSDISGKVLLAGEQKFSPGNCFISIDGSHLPPGIYVVQAIGTTFNEKIKMIKRN